MWLVNDTDEWGNPARGTDARGEQWEVWPGGSIAELVDIEGVGVLEGSQGLLFGRKASADFIDIVSQKADLSLLAASERLSYGSFNEAKGELAVNLPVGATLAARLAVRQFRHDSYAAIIAIGRRIDKTDSKGARPRLCNDVTLRDERGGIGSTLRIFGRVDVRSQSKDVFNAVADPYERKGDIRR